MMKRSVIIIACCLFAACHNDPPMIGRPTSASPDLKEHLINANKTIAQSEETAINEYIARRNWQMQQLPEGARVWEYVKGDGKQVGYEDSVSVRYDIEAINGKLIYKGIEETYIAGRRQQMIGLDQAVMQLHHGSRAKIILPSSLAFGIGGDGDRIPQSAILVIDIEIE